MFNPFAKVHQTKLRLQTVLAAAFTLQVAVAVGLVGYISFRGGQQTVDDLSLQLRQELSARIGEKLRAYLEAPHELNHLNAAAFARGELDVVGGQFGEKYLYDQMKFAPSVAFAFCGAAENGEFLGVLRSPDGPFLELATGNASNQFLREFYRFDHRGQRTHLIRRGERPYDARLRPWYQIARSQESPAWTDVYIAFFTRLPNVTASLPVYDHTGHHLLGVCGSAVLLPESFRTFLQNLTIGKTGQAFVIDRHGSLISNSTDEPLVVGEGDAAISVQAIDSRDEKVRSTARYLVEHFGSLDEIKESQQLDFRLRGQRQLVQVLPFRDRYGLDWLIVVTVPEADLMEQVRANNRNTVLLALFALSGAIAVGLVVAQWLITPILNLTIASQAMANNDFEQQVEVNSQFVELETLAQAFNSMASQLKTFFTNLETKVQERTVELANANRQISTLNEQLQAENIRMSAELEVARRIQHMILPKDSELKQIADLDIVGYMEPAEEVGGDYYDVLVTDGVLTIGIGDVTGHGLESGLLMLMTQTAVRTLQEIRESDPIRFLDTINRTLYQNIERMESDKNLTLAILNYADGQVSVSGQHEEVLVVRRDRTIERLDTLDLGLPIGLDDDIAEFIDYTTIALNAGDGVVLYTDGITEAYNPQDEQYGIERLCHTISQNWHQSALAVKQAVIEDVHCFIHQQKLVDDITLVVLKQQ